MRSIRSQLFFGLCVAAMLFGGIAIMGLFSVWLNKAAAPSVVLKSSTTTADCYVKQTPIGVEIQGSLSCVPKKGGS